MVILPYYLKSYQSPDQKTSSNDKLLHSGIRATVKLCKTQNVCTLIKKDVVITKPYWILSKHDF